MCKNVGKIFYKIDNNYVLLYLRYVAIQRFLSELLITYKSDI